MRYTGVSKSILDAIGDTPLLVAAYYAEAEGTTPAQRDAVLADVGRVVAGLAGG